MNARPNALASSAAEQRLTETIARAIYESQWVGEYPTEGVEHAMAIQNAEAALKAIETAGYVVVHSFDAKRAMLAAREQGK